MLTLYHIIIVRLISIFCAYNLLPRCPCGPPYNRHLIGLQPNHVHVYHRKLVCTCIVCSAHFKHFLLFRKRNVSLTDKQRSIAVLWIIFWQRRWRKMLVLWRLVLIFSTLKDSLSTTMQCGDFVWYEIRNVLIDSQEK